MVPVERVSKSDALIVSSCEPFVRRNEICAVSFANCDFGRESNSECTPRVVYVPGKVVQSGEQPKPVVVPKCPVNFTNAFVSVTSPGPIFVAVNRSTSGIQSSSLSTICTTE